MASRVITLPNGTKAAVDPALFAGDPGNTLGSLIQHYDTVVLAFRSDATSWILQRDSVIIGNGGDGDTDTATGFSDALSQARTSRLKNGFYSSKASFALQGIGIAPDSVAYAPTGAAGQATSTAYTCVGTGITLNNAQGIVGALVKTALGPSYWELYQQSRKCYSLLGLSSQMPGALAIASQQDAVNGGLGCGQQLQFRRTTIIPPGTTNTPEYLIKCNLSDKVSVASDPSFAAPAAGDCAAVKVRIFSQGFYCDDSGLPLVMDSDGASDYQEWLIASNDNPNV